MISAWAILQTVRVYSFVTGFDTNQSFGKITAL